MNDIHHLRFHLFFIIKPVRVSVEEAARVPAGAKVKVEAPDKAGAGSLNKTPAND